MTQKIIFLIFGAVIGVTTYAAVSYWGRSDDRSDARPTAASPTAPELPAETSKTGDAQKPAGQLVADDEGFFTFMVPADWIAKPVKGRDGLSEVVARSPDFKLRLDTAAEAPFVPHYYETGAELSVQVVPGEAAAAALGLLRMAIPTEFALATIRRLIPRASRFSGRC
ncbi:MAG: hypothetical protein UY92_C0015G0004 [Candidatus Magasanikbacteria bacterium GW2011_GWA2_56_11]|uniref:Uncharacterized protein n=1 Tax=Candidatus Magasanikbacteria bacterium GW2011_GWA2_56_11 TaxID=1619044 RepID=A0A0G2AK26_9BACT|nr:MAG: hypothetical protein UY92_C0015G0004 [Candidatus Magasanikbacteria bacterium GW2011_GWA2_56_11]